METMSGKTPRDLLRVVFRRRQLFLIASAIVAIGVLLASHTMELQYTGTTIFERRVDSAAEELMKGKAESFATQKLTLQNELIGHRAMTRVIDELHLLKYGPQDTSREAQMARQGMETSLAQSLRIDWRISSEQIDTVSLSYTGSDPILAAKIPNSLVQLYFDNISEEIKTRLKQSCTFLEQRVAEANKGLKDYRDRRLKFQAQNSEKFPEPGAFQQRVAQLTQEIQALRPQLDLAKQREAQLRLISSELTSQPTTQPGSAPASQDIWGPNPEYKRLQDELAKAQSELRDLRLLGGMKEKHPQVVKLKSKVEDLQALIARTPQVSKMAGMMDSPQGNLQMAFEGAAIKSQIQLLTGRLSQAQGELDQLQKHVAEYSKASQEYSDLLKSETERQEDVKRWNERLAQLQMQLGAEVANRATHQSTIQPARRQYIPSNPKLWLIVLAALFGGLGAGGGLAFAASMFDRSFSSTESAQHYFQLPVLGVIDEIVNEAQLRKRRRRRWILAPIMGVLLVGAIAASFWLTQLRLYDQDRYRDMLSNPVKIITSILEPAPRPGSGNT